MPYSHPIAVIDIGSNSVRIVIYDALKRVPLPLFNEKQSCGLGRDLDKTGKLNAKGVLMAHKALKRFVKLAQVMGAKTISALATAAVRDAEDGEAFVKDITKRYKLPVHVLTGVEEAQFAALGVLAGIEQVNGLIGDLGGGSLELVSVKDKKISYCQSFPLGVLRLNDGDVTHRKLLKEIDTVLDEVPLETYLKGKRFYAVGGSFRTLARIHIANTSYPLRVVHNYKISAAECLNAIRGILHTAPEQLAEVPGISLSRIETIPISALILKRIIEHGKPKEIVFSSNGIREGFLYYQLPPELQNEDPVISGSMALAGVEGPGLRYVYELMEWMTPLFSKEKEEEKSLRLAACILNDIACQEHPEYRAETAFNKIMDSFLTGIDHPARVFLALSVYHRYKTTMEPHTEALVSQFLTAPQMHRAALIGFAMRLSRNISASIPGILPHTSLSTSGRKLVLTLDPDTAELRGDVVEKRLRQLADKRKQTPVIVIEG